ncbi:MAG TPA: hypothetical protein VFK37_02385 [Bacillales bacterium]|nr:hypothetical protein [Bacillales bacterium]
MTGDGSEIPIGKRQTLSRILPYWGMTFDEEHSKIMGALSNQSVWVDGLTGSETHNLSRLLRHTGIHYLDTDAGANLKISIVKKENNTAPITLKTKTATFHLKPLRKQTGDVQTWIHKHLWLPARDPTYTCIFHSREEKNIPEWLFYLIVQYYMQPSFQRLSDIDFADYQEWTASVLTEINEELAACQLSLSHTPSQYWPQLPPNSDSSNEGDQHSLIKLFRNQSIKSDHQKINPFDQKQTTKKRTIHPFRKNNNRHSP